MIANNLEVPTRLGIFCDTCGECALEGFQSQSYGETVAAEQGWRIKARIAFGDRRMSHTCPGCITISAATPLQRRLNRSRRAARLAVAVTGAALVSVSAAAQTLGKGGTTRPPPSWTPTTNSLQRCPLQRWRGGMLLERQAPGTHPAATTETIDDQ